MGRRGSRNVQRFAPPPDLPRLIARRDASSVSYQPFAPEVYAKLPKTARLLQNGFHRELQAWRAQRLVERRGSVLAVIPARNEAAGIRRTLDSILRSTAGDPAIEVAIVDNGSVDSTVAQIRTWAAEHARVAELVDHTRPIRSRVLARDPGQRLRIHLLEHKVPGKVGALLAAQRLLVRAGYAPEWIAQVDADTQLQEGHIRGLIESASQNGEVAATGATREVRWDGLPPASFPVEAPGTPPGGWPKLVGQNLNGGFLVARSSVYFAGYRAIARAFPETATEDAVLSATLRMVGLKTGAAHPAFPFETLGPASEAEARARLVRVRTGGIQTARAFGSEMLARIGHTTSWNESIDLDHLERTWASGDPARMRWIAVMREALSATDRARLTGRPSWEPLR